MMSLYINLRSVLYQDTYMQQLKYIYLIGLILYLVFCVTYYFICFTYVRIAKIRQAVAINGQEEGRSTQSELRQLVRRDFQSRTNSTTSQSVAIRRLKGERSSRIIRAAKSLILYLTYCMYPRTGRIIVDQIVYLFYFLLLDDRLSSSWCVLSNLGNRCNDTTCTSNVPVRPLA